MKQSIYCSHSAIRTYRLIVTVTVRIASFLPYYLHLSQSNASHSSYIWLDFSEKPYYYADEPKMINGSRGRFVEVYVNDDYSSFPTRRNLFRPCQTRRPLPPNGWSTDICILSLRTRSMICKASKSQACLDSRNSRLSLSGATLVVCAGKRFANLCLHRNLEVELELRLGS